jgi:murein L,D-transpeptidase YcbB/YkuD
MAREFGNGRQDGALARWFTALAVVPALLAAPVQAGQTVAPPPVVRTVPAPQVQPLAPVPLPVLTPAQAAQLRAVLDANAMTQGLRSAPPTAQTPAPQPQLDNDALVRAALDHARAVHAGRLDTADFLHDWGLRPPPFDPLPGFADAVRRDRLAAWIANLPPPYAGYDGLVKGLANYRAIAAAGGWQRCSRPAPI